MYLHSTIDVYLPERSGFFPVKAGGAMPLVPGCQKQDYWVVFVVGIDQGE